MKSKRYTTEQKIRILREAEKASQFHPVLTIFRQPAGHIIDKIIERLTTCDFRSGTESLNGPLVRRASC